MESCCSSACDTSATPKQGSCCSQQQQSQQQQSPTTLVVSMFVPMTCQSCVEAIHAILDPLDGVDSVDVQLEEETVTVTGSARPSVLLRTLNDAGRTASVCGLGAGAGGSRSRGASVAVFGRHNSAAGTLTSVVRFIQVSDSMLVVDGWVEALQPGDYCFALHAAGDLTDDWRSTGPIYDQGCLPGFTVAAPGGQRVDFFHEVHGFATWQSIGRALVLHHGDHAQGDGVAWTIVARTAGLRENPKRVCPCGPVNTDAAEADRITFVSKV